MDLIRYTPDWMLRVVADGALAVVWLFPSILGLVIYAWICFLCVDAVLSFVTAIVMRRTLTRALSSEMAIGHPATRLRYWLPHLFSLLLKAWVGLPAFHVINLIISKDGADIGALKSIVTGYAWQTATFQSLEGRMVTGFSPRSNTAQAAQLILVVAFVLYTYFCAYKGFDVVRRIRKVADILLPRIGLSSHQSPSVRQCILTLRANGWSRPEIVAGTWFLVLVNARILKRIREYETVTPLQYAGFKVTTSFAVAVGLTLVHPVVAALYLSSLMKGLLEMRSFSRKYTSYFCQLPEWTQASVRSTYGCDY